MLDELNPLLISKKQMKYKDVNWNMLYFLNPLAIVFIKDEITDDLKIYSHQSCFSCEFMRCNRLNCLKRLDEQFLTNNIIIFYSTKTSENKNDSFINFILNENKIEKTTKIQKSDNFQCANSLNKKLSLQNNELNLLSKCRRFIILDSFKINFKPIRKRILLDQKEYSQIPESIKELVYYEQELSGNILCYFDRKIIRNSTDEFKNEIYQYLNQFSYEFSVFPYYDIVSNQIMYVLKYKRNNKTPLVRIHSIRQTDSIIPIRSWSNYSKWKKSLDFIIKSGHGYAILIQGDGKGCGLPAYFVNENKTMSHIGLNSDNRDFEGAISLLNDVCFEKNISVLYSTDKEKIKPIFEKYHFQIQKWYK